MRNKSRKIAYFTRSNAALAGLLAVFAAVALAPWLIREKSEEAVLIEEPKQVRRAIDGLLVAESGQNPPLAGVMIENMVEAQPVSGIADASLVFEAVTEANITRFLAYFLLPSPPSALTPTLSQRERGIEEERGGFSTSPLPAGEGQGEGVIEIGPVRSARPYYLDWASEFVTLFAHVGSSPAAYEMLRKQGVEGVQDLDQWYNPQYFYFKNGKPRPHHIYTSVGLLAKAYSVFRHSEEPRDEESRTNVRPTSVGDPSASPQDDKLESWLFKSDAPPDLRGDVSEIRVQYKEPYDVRWVYDKFENYYKRWQWNGIHKDAGGKEIIAKNIAVAFQKMKILDEVGRKEFETLGEGKGLVFQDGRVVVGRWKKQGPRERMRFYDAQGEEVEFNAGVTWVEVVPEGYEVRF